VFKFTNAVCKTSGSTIIINECRLRAVNRARNTFNFQMTLLEKVTDILYMAQLFKKSNGYKPWLYKFSVDGCRFLDKPFNPVIIILYRMFKDFSNFNHSCPYIVSIDNNMFSHQVVGITFAGLCYNQRILSSFGKTPWLTYTKWRIYGEHNC
ncbi:maker538, partial [Drosophila busckii]